MLWLKVHSHWLLKACLLGSTRKLSPPSCQILLGLPQWSAIRGMQFPGTMCTCNQGPMSRAWAHCISCKPSACSSFRRCCCCPLQCDRQRMETRPELCWMSRPIPQIMIFVFPAFTPSSFSSIASLQVKSLLTHSSSDSAMMLSYINFSL